MTLPRTVADVLAGHVTLEIECIDRMYLNLYVPKLQYPNGIVQFFRVHRGHPFVSSVLMDPMTRAFVTAIHRFVKEEGVPLVEFKKGQRKDDVAREHLACFEGEEGVLFVGRAQEKTSTFRTEKRRNPVTGATYPWIVPASVMVNHFYFYGVDADFGPFFIKFATYFPYTAKCCINGHEWAKRQAAKAGIGFEALDNGFAACEDPVRLQRICDRLDGPRIEAFVRKWLRRLPHPFTPIDRAAGYRYDVSILQAEFSLTQVLDRPLSGRLFFEEVIRENLDVGRPDEVSVIFGRRVTRRTPGRFRTRVITEGVVPSLYVYYRDSRIKQYFIIWTVPAGRLVRQGSQRRRHVADEALEAPPAWRQIPAQPHWRAVRRTAWQPDREVGGSPPSAGESRPGWSRCVAGGTRPTRAGRRAA